MWTHRGTLMYDSYDARRRLSRARLARIPRIIIFQCHITFVSDGMDKINEACTCYVNGRGIYRKMEKAFLMWVRIWKFYLVMNTIMFFLIICMFWWFPRKSIIVEYFSGKIWFVILMCDYSRFEFRLCVDFVA